MWLSKFDLWQGKGLGVLYMHQQIWQHSCAEFYCNNSIKINILNINYNILKNIIVSLYFHFYSDWTNFHIENYIYLNLNTIENSREKRPHGRGLMNGKWDGTNLRIYTSWENSLCIFSSKLSCFRTLMAKSWLHNVPLYLCQLSVIQHILTHKHIKEMKWYYSQITERSRCNFLFKSQPTCFTCWDAIFTGGKNYMSRYKVHPNFLLLCKLCKRRTAIFFQLRLLLDSHPNIT